MNCLHVVGFTIWWMMPKSIALLITCANFVPGLEIISAAECNAHVIEILPHPCRHVQLNWEIFRMISSHCSIIFITWFRILELKKVQRYMLSLKPHSRYHFHEECTTVNFILLSNYRMYSVDTIFELRGTSSFLTLGAMGNFCYKKTKVFCNNR